MKPYYRIIAVLLPLSLLLASTCKKGDSAGLKTIRLNTPVEMAIGEKGIVHGGNAVISITEITDNRCPADVQCFSAGEVKLKLSVTGMEANNSVLNFCIGQCDNRYKTADTLAVEYHNQAYTVILSEVNPYPGTVNKTKTAVFTIRKN